MDEPRRARRLIFALLTCTLLCIVTLGAVLVLRPPIFASHEEAIGYVLDQHGVAYEQVALAQTRLDTLNFYSYGRYSAPYGASVTVQLPNKRHVNGRLECRVQMTSCYLFLTEVGITNELVPDVTTTPRWSPFTWLAKHIPPWMRAMRPNLGTPFP